MAELNTAEADTAAALAADAGFAAGFTGTPPTEVAKVVEEPKAEPEAKPAATATAPKPDKPEYIRVTRQEWDNSKAALGKIPTLESALAKLTGSIPKADAIIQQVIEKVQSQTPSGLAVEFSDEDFAELTAEYPELAKLTRSTLERAFKKASVKGTGPAEATAPKAAIEFDSQEAFDKAVEATLKKKADAEAAETREKETKALLETFPDWGKIVGAPFAMGTPEPVNTPWREWATTHDQAAITTDSPAEVMASIARFNESQNAPTPPAKPDKGAARRSVIADAVTPKAEGASPPLTQPTTADEAFGDGFKKVKRQ